MKQRYFAVLAFAFVMQFQLLSTVAFADKLRFPDGTSLDGVVQKIEKGQVTVAVGDEIKVFDVLDIAGIEFDTLGLTTGTSRLPLEHFLTNIEAQEMIGHFQEVEESADAVRKLIGQTQEEWENRKSIEASETAEWEAVKKSFRKPLARYQEVLNDLYFHVLGKVDEYNRLMKEADSIRVGVKGWFQAGSTLIPSDMEKLPLKKYVPENWYDTIYYEGYDMGYSDAAEKYKKDPFHSRE